MKNNKVISIIGSGISGLVCALKLATSKLTKDYTFRIFEHAERVGGRAHSVKVDDLSIDLGAGRFSPVLHPNVSQLIHDSGGKVEIFPFTKMICQHLQHESSKNILKYLKPKIKDSYNESFFQFLNNQIGNEQSHAIIKGLGYDSLYLPQISPKIAYDIIEKHPEIQCYSDNKGYKWFNLVDGFSSLVNSLYDQAIKLGVKFFFQHKLIHFLTKPNNTQLGFYNSKQQEILQNTTYAVFALPPTAMSLLNIDFPKGWSDFNYASIPLFKGFLFFETPWWKEYGLENKVAIVDNHLRKLYFKSDKYLFFYTDSANADFWHEETKKGEDDYLITVMHLLSKALNIDIKKMPWPICHKFKFWKNGVEFALESTKEHPPVLSKNNGKIIATSDAYTPHCGWMEGAIIAGRNAADNILNQLKTEI